jgi:flagellar basal-body rod protein FlgB
MEDIMLQSNVFDYISVLDKAADASWMRHVALSNNNSNVTTPGYKRQDVAFESEFRKALGSCRHESMDAKVARLRRTTVKPVGYTDYSTLSYRLDGNNVDPDAEPVMLAENQLKYQGLISAINNEFQNLQTVLK